MYSISLDADTAFASLWDEDVDDSDSLFKVTAPFALDMDTDPLWDEDNNLWDDADNIGIVIDIETDIRASLFNVKPPFSTTLKTRDIAKPFDMDTLGSLWDEDDEDEWYLLTVPAPF